MIKSIQASPTTLIPALKITLPSQAPLTNTLRFPDFTLKPLAARPDQAVLGVVNVAFWALSAYFAVTNTVSLVREIGTQAHENWTKIGLAVKKAFLSQTAFVCSSAFVTNWAHQAKLFSLGRFTGFVNGLYYGSSIVYSTVDGVWAACELYQEKNAILEAQHPCAKEEHHKKFFLNMLKLATDVAFVAWGVLGLGGVIVGATVTPWVMMPLALGGFGFMCLSFIYEDVLDEQALQRTT